MVQSSKENNGFFSAKTNFFLQDGLELEEKWISWFHNSCFSSWRVRIFSGAWWGWGDGGGGWVGAFLQVWAHNNA